MISTDTSPYLVAAGTHPGMSGKNNEDRYGVQTFRTGGKNSTPVLLAVLSDGIGGHRAGEVASRIAVDSITQQVAASNISDPAGVLKTAVQNASNEIYLQAQTAAEQHGMGATCVCAWLVGSRLYAATVGDSRLYLMRGSRIRQLSTDHTWIQEAIEAGVIQPEQAVGHPNAHVIRRYMGSPEPPLVDFRLRLANIESDQEAEANQGMPLRPGDRLLLCSDGLTDLVQNDEILAAFQQKPMEQAVQSLIDLANERGGHDNITLVCVQVPQNGAVQPPRPAWKGPLLILGALLALVVVAALLVVGILWYSGQLDPGVKPTLSPTVPAQKITQPVVVNTSDAPQPTFAQPQRASATPEPVVPLPPPEMTPWPTHTLQP